MRIKLTLTINEKILKKFKTHCIKNDINLSRRLEKYMQKELKKCKK